jgi:YVTN family beta-propeller protein
LTSNYLIIIGVALSVAALLFIGLIGTYMSVADEESTAIIMTVPVKASLQSDIGLNTATGTMYVTNSIANDISVIDTSTDAVLASIPVGTNPVGLAVNSNTNLVYIANQDDSSVTVVDGTTNSAVSIISGIDSPFGIAANEATNKIYVTEFTSGSMKVIDGDTNSVTATITDVGNNPARISVNSITNKVYVTDASTARVYVIDGNNNSVSSIADSEITSPFGIGINSNTNKIYVSNFQLGEGSVVVIDGATDTVSGVVPFPSSAEPYYVAVDPVLNEIIVTNAVGGFVKIIDGNTNAIVANMSTPSSPVGIAVLPSLHKIYVAETAASIVSVGANN